MTLPGEIEQRRRGDSVCTGGRRTRARFRETLKVAIRAHFLGHPAANADAALPLWAGCSHFFPGM